MPNKKIKRTQKAAPLIKTFDLKLSIMKIIVLIVLFSIIILFLFGSKKDNKKEIWETTPGGPYTLILSEDEMVCEHPTRSKESIRWDKIDEIRLITTDEGPLLPDMWYVFIGESGGCSVPSEAKDFDLLWDEIKKRFDGFNYNAIIEAGTDNDQKVLWKK